MKAVFTASAETILRYGNMAKKDNMNFVLMFYRNVNLKCDGKLMRLRYKVSDDYNNNKWFVNDKESNLSTFDLIESLKSKYKNIKVIWKRQF